MNTIPLSNLIPAIYCRKSTESEERQVLSLPAQREEAAKLASQFGILNTVQYEEAKSAKQSGQRVVFARMMKDFRRNKINAIVCWKLDRLARNMIEGGEIIDMLQRGIIKAIITPSKVYYPNENALLMAVEFGAANQYSRDLSENVKRGQERKAKGGYPHAVACIGYINDKSGEKGEKKWIVDEERFPIVKQIFEMYLSGNYSGGKLHEWATETAKLTTRPRKKTGNKLISRAAIYRMLRDPIYAGIFYIQGNRYELSKDLPRAINEVEHNKILGMLCANDAPKTQTHEVTFSGFIFSNDDEYIGPDVKMQLICDCKHKFSYLNKTYCPKCKATISNLRTPKYIQYIYYRNVSKAKRKETVKCLSEKRATDILLSYVAGNLLLSSDLITWCAKYFNEIAEKDSENKKAVLLSQNRRVEDLEAKKSRYREMLADGLFTKAEYNTDIEKINKEISSIHSLDGSERQWLQRAHEMLTIGSELINTFEKGSVVSKRAILSRFSSNLRWDEKDLIITPDYAMQVLIDGLNEAETLNSQFERENTLANKDETGAFTSVCHILRRTLDDVRIVLQRKSAM